MLTWSFHLIYSVFIAKFLWNFAVLKCKYSSNYNLEYVTKSINLMDILFRKDIKWIMDLDDIISVNGFIK